MRGRHFQKAGITPLHAGIEHEDAERSELSLTDIIGVGTGRRGDRSGLAGIRAALADTSARSVARESSSTGDGDDEDEVNQLTQSQPFSLGHAQPFTQSHAVETLTGTSSNKSHSRLSDSALPSGLGEQSQGQLSEDGDVLGGSVSSKPPLPPASRHAYTLPAQARQTGLTLVAPDTHTANTTISSGDSTSAKSPKSTKTNDKSLKGGKAEKAEKADKAEKEGKAEKHHGNRMFGGLKAMFRSGRNGHGKARSKLSLGGSEHSGAERQRPHP